MPDIQPLPPNDSRQPPAGFTTPKLIEQNAAADVIRNKLARIYADEPDASEELLEAEAVTKRSKHQEYMHQLSISGKDLATIQTDWHNYYLQLSDEDKHQVWQEFYSTSTVPQPALAKPAAANEPEKPAAIITPAEPFAIAEHKHEAHTTPSYKKASKRAANQRRDLRSPQAIRATIRNKVTANGKLKVKHHVQSLLFGLGMGAIAIFVVMFTFFNQTIIAPFLQPSRAAAATPVIVDTASVPATDEPQVIIPKINVQIPVIYGLPSSDEDTVQTALESGVAHYPTTALPGNQGNVSIFGHSSNNIFNKGKYKFAFVLLNRMEVGDTFYLTYEKKLYVYKITSKLVVDPSQVEVLDPIPGKSTATLITCDPPGTTLKRLVVIGEQISPDPVSNAAPAAATPSLGQASVNLPGDPPSFASNFFSSSLGKLIGTVVILSTIVGVLRWVSRSKD